MNTDQIESEDWLHETEYFEDFYEEDSENTVNSTELRDTRYRDAPNSEWLSDPWEGLY